MTTCVFSVDRLKEVKYSDRDDIHRHLDMLAPAYCDFNLANLICWGSVYRTRWAATDGRFYIHFGEGDYFLIHAVAAPSIAELLGISDGLRRQGLQGNVTLIDERFVAAHRDDIERHFTVMPDEDAGDYVYRTAKLVELRGSKLHKKRNLIAQFRREHPDYRVIPLDGKLLPTCAQLAHEWCKRHDCDQDTQLRYEKQAFTNALEHFSDLGLEGLALTEEDRVMAFSIFSRQNDEMYTVHFEKQDDDVKGASQAVNWETAKTLQSQCRYINREQDLGVEGLRRAKRSYDPDFVITPRHLIRR